MPARTYPIFKAPGTLAIVRRPPANALTDTLSGLSEAGYCHIFCLLEAGEMDELGLADEPGACGVAGLAFHHFPIRDHSVPANAPDMARRVREVVGFCESGQGVAVHCKASIGRSGLFAAACLVAHGQSPQIAFARVAQARHVRLPDPHPQRDWLAQNAALFAGQAR